MQDSTPRIVCFGEVLWDCYPDNMLLGGAPLNVAAHLIKLGSHADIICRIGKDEMGSKISKQLLANNIPPDFIQEDSQLPTGQVLVELNEGIPSYEIMEPVAWDAIEANLENRILVAEGSAFVYGTLACRSDASRSALLHLLSLSNLNICDLNIRQQFYSKELITQLLNKTHILKINEDEATLLSTIFNLKEAHLYKDLSELFGLDLIIKTMGGEGAEVYSQGKTYVQAANKIEVVDTVGSGDAFLAGFIHAFLGEQNIELALELASFMGGYVTTQAGAIPDYDISTLRTL